MNSKPEPKLFISYSWSNPDHESWVVSFAEELLSQGIEVILDKWALQPGHDAYAFMESMVTDPTVNKVVLVCDQKYAQKSNDRAGGAGAEAQIITPELYAKKAQDKFVAVFASATRRANLIYQSITVVEFILILQIRPHMRLSSIGLYDGLGISRYMCGLLKARSPNFSAAKI
jgi:hypothetical protein